MNSNLLKAKAILTQGGYTCVLIKDDKVYTSIERGVKPLMLWLDEKTDLNGFYAADKVVGKATAFLYILLGVRAVYAPVMSKMAVKVLTKHNIEVFCDTEVDAIRNRTNTGFCPMEQAVNDITDPLDAPKAIKSALAKLNSK